MALAVDTCRFETNTAQFGGALWTSTSGADTIADSIFDANPARYSGGGIYTFGATFTNV